MRKPSLTHLAYDSYCAYCKRLGITPLSFDVWNAKTSPSTGNFQ